MTPLAAQILARWTRLPDGSYRRPSLPHVKPSMCMSDGERMPHSHYAWAKDALWAVYGDMSNAGMLSGDE